MTRGPESSLAPSRRSLLALLLAIVLPALVFAVAYEGLRDSPDVHGFAAVFDDKLAEAGDPQVVVLGSSMANRGIDLDVLARELGVRRTSIVMLQLPHAEGAHWYAILKNRVFAHGYRPKLVLIAGAMTTMLNHDLLSEQLNLDRLIEQLTEDEPVIARKVFGFDDGRAFASEFWRERAGLWRTAMLDQLRAQVVGRLFTRRHRADEGARLADKVNETVFANERMDYGLHAATPTGLSIPEHPAADAKAYDLRGEALLGEMQALADAHGARVIWVRMPFPPSNPTMDVVPPDIEEAALAWLEEIGAGFLDMRSSDLTDADFEDMRHLSRRGAIAFTTTLGRALVGLGALDPDGGVGVVRGLGTVPPPERTGTLPPLPSLPGDRCRREAPAGALAAFDDATRASLSADVRPPFEIRADGVVLSPGDVTADCAGAWSIAAGRLVVSAPRPTSRVEVAWLAPTWQPQTGGGFAWVLPGTTLSWHIPAGWKLPHKAFDVVARGLAVGEGPAEASLRIGGADVALTAVDRRLLGAFRPPPPTGPWTLEATVPEGAAPVLLHHLAVGRPPATTALLGAAETLYGASVRIVGGRLDDTRGEAHYTAPPALTAIPARLTRGPRTTAVIVVPLLADLADSDAKDDARPSVCSPVRVLEDGVPLPLPHATCFDTFAKGQGRTCHAGNVFFVTAPDDSDPETNHRAYTLALDPDRACDTWVQRGATTLRGSWWLYPGDTATFEVPASRLSVFRDGANALAVEVVPMVTDPDAPLHVELIADGRTVLDTTWLPPSRTRRQRTATFPLDPPLPPTVQRLVLRLTNPSAKTFHLVTMAAVAEAYGTALDDPPEASAASASTVLAPTRWGREGSTPPLQAPLVRGELANGVVDARIFPLWPVSQTSLDRLGLGPWSPLRLAADGAPLLPMTSRESFRGGCDACFFHMGQATLVRAPGGATSKLTATLDEAFPLRARDGGEAWWLYPGTTGWIDVDHVDADEVEVRVRAIGLHPLRDEAGHDLVLRVQGGEAPLVPVEGASVVGASLRARPDRGHLRIEIADQSERGFALLAEVVVVDGDTVARVLPSAGPLVVAAREIDEDDER